MIRNITRNLISFLAAIVLLALLLCAVEVSLRSWRLRHQLTGIASAEGVDDLVSPSESAWIDVRPHLDLLHRVGPEDCVRIQTDERGLRGASVVIPKPQGTYRILCLGGDCVFGSTLNEPETLPQRLQRVLNMHSGMPVEVINAGCPQSGPLVNLLRYRNHLCALQADLIILFLAEEDLGRDREVRGALHLDESRNPAYAVHPALCGQSSALVNGLCQEFVTLDWLLTEAGNMLVAKAPGNHAARKPNSEDLQRDLAAIVPLSRLVSGNFGHLTISIAPSVWSVDRARQAMDQNRSELATAVQHFLEEVHLADQVEVQDGLTVFCKAADARAYFSPVNGGLSAAGNELYAQSIAGFLLETIPGLKGTTTSPETLSPSPSLSPIPFSPSQTQQPGVHSIIR